MTIASKLFYFQRHQPHRPTSDHQSPANPTADRRASRPRRSGHVNSDRRVASSRRLLSHCAAGQSEPETICLDRSNGNLAAGFRSPHGHETRGISGVRVRRDELDHQLPCSVLQAKARLVERLRDFQFTDNRGQAPAWVLTLHEHTSSERVNISDSRDMKAGTTADFLGSEISFGHVLLSHHTDQTHWLQNTNKQRLISYSSTYSSLQGEVSGDAVVGEDVLTTVPECSICLERFLDGEELMKLPCKHRFHHSCLEPWLEAHDVCPYCRAIC